MENAIFCQSCYMEMKEAKDFGTETDGGTSADYCCHCYKNGDFKYKQTLEQAVKSNIRFWREEGDKSDDEARARIMEIFPTLKRWKTCGGVV